MKPFERMSSSTKQVGPVQVSICGMRTQSSIVSCSNSVRRSAYPGTLGLYALFGGVSLIAGAAALLAPGIVLGDATTPLTAHLIREEAAAFVFIGLMFFWCIRHFEQRRPVHLALLVF